jgi:RNA polymerase sigma-B factor
MLPALTRCDDRELIRRHRAGDRRARETLIVRYLPLARRLALRYHRSTLPLEDLVQVASLGLVKAVDRWDPDRGLAFSTFAVPTVLGDLRRYFRDTTWAVRPPRDVQELALAVEGARARLTARLGREPTARDFAAHLMRSPEDVADALQAVDRRFAGSFDAPVLDEADEPGTVGELQGHDDPGYRRVEAGATVEQLLAILDRRAREIVRLRFADDLMQREIGDRLGLTQMHVSRILRASLTRLEAYLIGRGYQPRLAMHSAPE